MANRTTGAVTLAPQGNTSISGIQFGDEGKGQIVDYLSGDYDYVVRYNGGANAGHTVLIGNTKHALHLVPSGILRQETVNVIANGVVLDPYGFLKEVAELREAGVRVEPENLMISDRSHVVMPYHKDEDDILEQAMAALDGDAKAIETTRRGIGPCYADKSYRSTAVRVVDMLDPEFRKISLPRILDVKRASIGALVELAGLSWDGINSDEQLKQIDEAAEKIRPFVRDTRLVLTAALNTGKRILFEGANASLLDIDFGTYPFVTSSNCTSLGIYPGTGLPGGIVNNSFGVAKLYMSRVGGGPFPTEIHGDEAEAIRNAAGEFGTTTGRPRRIGWLDLVALRHAAAVNGTTGLVLTGLAFLRGVDPIRICTSYESDGRTLAVFPSSSRVLYGVEPVYEEVSGFDEDVRGCRNLTDLPDGARRLIDRVEVASGFPVRAVCVGKERDQVLPR